MLADVPGRQPTSVCSRIPPSPGRGPRGSPAQLRPWSFEPFASTKSFIREEPEMRIEVSVYDELTSSTYSVLTYRFRWNGLGMAVC